MDVSYTTERKLGTFENKIWRNICGSVLKLGIGNWQKTYNRKLQELMKVGLVTNFIKGQRTP